MPSWPTARQQLAGCAAAPSHGGQPTTPAPHWLACACFRADPAAAAARSSAVGVAPSSLAEALDTTPDPAGFRCLGGVGGGGGGNASNWKADCVWASDSGIPGRFHCLCACGGGGGGDGHSTCADVCSGRGACPPSATETALSGDLCQLYPTAVSFSDSLIGAVVAIGLLGVAVFLMMRLVRCNVPVLRARLRSCWRACPPVRLLQQRRSRQRREREAGEPAVGDDEPNDERRPLEQAAEGLQPQAESAM